MKKGELYFNIIDYGAVAGEDCTTAIQDAINDARVNGGAVLFPGIGPYFISDTLVLNQPAPPASSDSLSDVHFMTDMRKFTLVSYSQAVIKATAAMDNMIYTSVITATGAGGYSNFYTDILGLHLDGGGFATNGINLNEAMHGRIEKCSIDNVDYCIANNGYGVHQIIYNVLRGNIAALNFVSGGDSLIMHNDVFVKNNQTGFLMKPWAGNTTIFRNIFTPTDTTMTNSGCTAIYLKADNAGDDANAIATTKIQNNAFDGMEYGVKTKGYSTSIRNVEEIEIFNNYIADAGVSVGGTLAYLEFTRNVLVQGNSCGLVENTGIMKQLVYALNCNNVRIFNNTVQICTDDAIVFENTFAGMIQSNDFNNFGSSASTKCGVRLTGASTYENHIKDNRFSQQVGAGSINGVVEENSADYNIADYNYFEGVTSVEYTKVGGNSDFISRLYGYAPPTTKTWIVGAEMKNRIAAAGGYAIWICVTAGTPGTWKGYGLIES